jgi:hypothetical protein
MPNLNREPITELEKLYNYYKGASMNNGINSQLEEYFLKNDHALDIYCTEFLVQDVTIPASVSKEEAFKGYAYFRSYDPNNFTMSIVKP